MKWAGTKDRPLIQFEPGEAARLGITEHEFVQGSLSDENFMRLLGDDPDFKIQGTRSMLPLKPG